jgi:hypothetical protein
MHQKFNLVAAARSIANPDDIFEFREPAEFLWHLSNDKGSDRGIKKAFKLSLSSARMTQNLQPSD